MITTQFYGYGNGRFGHPEQNRALSLREGAILQSFPDDYVFVDRVHPAKKRIRYSYWQCSSGRVRSCHRHQYTKAYRGIRKEEQS